MIVFETPEDPERFRLEEKGITINISGELDKLSHIMIAFKDDEEREEIEDE